MPGGTVMGHEFCGEVVAVGAGAEPRWRRAPGPRCCPVFSCGACAWCRTGEVAHCDDGPADRPRRQPRRLRRVRGREPALSLRGAGGSPGDVRARWSSRSRSACTPPGSPRSRPGDDVLVIGAGPVGLTTARWAEGAGRGARRRRPIRWRPAVRSSDGFGATDVRRPDDRGARAAGYDVVIDCVGKPGLLDRCIDAVGDEGEDRGRRRVHRARPVPPDAGPAQGADDRASPSTTGPRSSRR